MNKLIVIMIDGLGAEKTVTIFHEVRRNSHSIAPIFVENIGSFSKLKIIGLNQSFLKLLGLDINVYPQQAIVS